MAFIDKRRTVWNCSQDSSAYKALICQTCLGRLQADSNQYESAWRVLLIPAVKSASAKPPLCPAGPWRADVWTLDLRAMTKDHLNLMMAR